MSHFFASTNRFVGFGRIVHKNRNECCEKIEVVLTENGVQLGGVGREVPLRTKLRCWKPQLRHLGKNPIYRQLNSPARHFTDSPGDGGCSHAIHKTHCLS